MHQWRKITAGVAVAAIGSILGATAAHAQVGYDPTKKLVPLVTVTADANGDASADVTLPEDTTPGYEVIASGVDPAGQPRSVIANVSSGSGALGSPSDAPIVLIAFQQTVNRSVHVSASGFKPASKVGFSVRYSVTAVEGETITAGGSLPLTGSNIGLLIAVGVATLLVGGALAGGSRLSRSHHAPAED